MVGVFFRIEELETFSPLKWKEQAVKDFINVSELREQKRQNAKPLNSGFAVTFEELTVFRELALKGLEEEKIIKFYKENLEVLYCLIFLFLP